MLRILLSDDQSRRLAVKGKILGRKMLEQLAGIVTPDTLLRWHRELVVRHWDYSGRHLTPHIEFFMRSVKEECLHRLVLFGETALLSAVREFVLHYHAERNHRGLGNRLIEPGEEVGRAAGEVVCRERQGGMLRYYHREAA